MKTPREYYDSYKEDLNSDDHMKRKIAGWRLVEDMLVDFKEECLANPNCSVSTCILIAQDYSTTWDAISDINALDNKKVHLEKGAFWEVASRMLKAMLGDILEKGTPAE